MKLQFEELKVWQRAVKYTRAIHELTRSFPKEEKFILTSQIKRAADSIALNIAEGALGQTRPEFSRFLSYSIRSAAEVVTCLYIAKERDFIQDEHFQELYEEAKSIIRMTQALRKSINPPK